MSVKIKMYFCKSMYLYVWYLLTVLPNYIYIISLNLKCALVTNFHVWFMTIPSNVGSSIQLKIVAKSNTKCIADSVLNRGSFLQETDIHQRLLYSCQEPFQTCLVSITALLNFNDGYY